MSDLTYLITDEGVDIHLSRSQSNGRPTMVFHLPDGHCFDAWVNYTHGPSIEAVGHPASKEELRLVTLLYERHRPLALLLL